MLVTRFVKYRGMQHPCMCLLTALRCIAFVSCLTDSTNLTPLCNDTLLHGAAGGKVTLE